MSPAFVIVKDFPDKYDYCGTGFFISGDGLFFTAAHIFEKDPDCQKYWIAPNASDLDALVPFTIVCCEKSKDIALCRADYRPQEWLSLTPILPKRGDKVFSLGYSGRENNIGKIEVREGKFIAHSEELTIPEIPPYSPKIFPAIFFEGAIKEGFSGGPTLNEKGEIIGLHSLINSDENILSILNVTEAVSVSVRSDALIELVRNYPFG